MTILKESYAEALVVPDKALSTFQSLDVVYVVNDKDTVEQREVVLGPRLEGEVVISSGLQEGDRVVTKGLQKVRPGSPVQVAGTV